MCFSALWHFRVKVGNNCVVCAEAILIGNITIGDGTTIHPRAQIIAEAGPIIIGENNLIEENACIVNRHVGNPLVIGNDNVFEIGSRCEASKVGDGNVIEMKASVGPDVEITNNCVIGVMTNIRTQEILQNSTVIVGGSGHRRKAVEKTLNQKAQFDVLTKVLRSYHYMYSQGK